MTRQDRTSHADKGTKLSDAELEHVVDGKGSQGPEGNDTITDFEPGKDVLHLESVYPHDIHVSLDGNGNTVISFTGTTITLQGLELTREEVLENYRAK